LWLRSFFIVAAFLALPAAAQIQQAWVAHYDNGITNGTNQAVKMALDSSGNIYVTGFSQNANSNLGYVTIKYAPNGNQLWATRYDSSNFPSAQPAAMVLDASNDVIVTGKNSTIKYDPNGNQLWTDPYAGVALACDPAGDVYVTGFGTNFNTVKLAPTGSNLWLTTFVDFGPTVAQAIVVDTNGNCYVSGSDLVSADSEGNITNYYLQLLTIKYASNGSKIWSAPYPLRSSGIQPMVPAEALDNADNLYVLMNAPSYANATLKYSNTGSLIWITPIFFNGYSVPHALALDSTYSVLITGQFPSSFLSDYSPLFSYDTMKLDTNGSTLWTDLYPVSAAANNIANSLAVDSSNNCYVTGYSPGTNSLNDIVTIKYGPNGNQIWLQRYSGPGHGNAAGNAIAVDANGNVYVTGYDTTAAGGTEIVTIKYSPVTLQKKPDGTVMLQTQGAPGESFDIQASADLQSWLDLGSATADTNGLMQFDDTNAPNYPARFYYTNPQ
jgi:hypothetical protein